MAQVAAQKIENECSSVYLKVLLLDALQALELGVQSVAAALQHQIPRLRFVRLTRVTTFFFCRKMR